MHGKTIISKYSIPEDFGLGLVGSFMYSLIHRRRPGGKDLQDGLLEVRLPQVDNPKRDSKVDAFQRYKA